MIDNVLTWRFKGIDFLESTYTIVISNEVKEVAAVKNCCRNRIPTDSDKNTDLFLFKTTEWRRTSGRSYR